MTDIDVLASATAWLTAHPGDGGWIAEPINDPTHYGVWATFAVEADGLPVTDMPPLFVDTRDGTVLPLGTLPPGFAYDTTRDPWDRLTVPKENDMSDTTTAAIVGDEVVTETEAPWHGVLAPEGVRTGDGREFAPDSIRWRDLPLPLRWQIEDDIGHDGAVIVGRIDAIERRDGALHATGVWDTGESATEARRLNQNKMLRGVSVDLDDATVEFIDATTGEPIEGDEMLDAMFDPDAEEPIMRVTDGRISGATMCAIPAFQEAEIIDGMEGAEVVAATADTKVFAGMMPDGETPCSCDEDDDDFMEDCVCPDDEEAPVGVPASAFHLVASVTSPTYAAIDFTDPGFAEGDGRLLTLSNGKQGTPLTVTPDRRVFGHLATWGTCHIGFEGVCITPPRSYAAYAYFSTGSVTTDIGEVPVGQITMGTGHAAPSLRARPAAEHYDNTGTVVADIAVGEDEWGIWYSGRLRPDATEEQITALKHGGALSGDWRKIGGNLELVAALAVNTPGFPVPRVALAASGSGQTSLVAAGILPQPESTDFTLHDVTRSVLASLDRRTKMQGISETMRRIRLARIDAMRGGL